MRHNAAFEGMVRCMRDCSRCGSGHGRGACIVSNHRGTNTLKRQVFSFWLQSVPVLHLHAAEPARAQRRRGQSHPTPDRPVTRACAVQHTGHSPGHGTTPHVHTTTPLVLRGSYPGRKTHRHSVLSPSTPTPTTLPRRASSDITTCDRPARIDHASTRQQCRLRMHSFTVAPCQGAV